MRGRCTCRVPLDINRVGHGWSGGGPGEVIHKALLYYICDASMIVYRCRFIMQSSRRV